MLVVVVAKKFDFGISVIILRLSFSYGKLGILWPIFPSVLFFFSLRKSSNVFLEDNYGVIPSSNLKGIKFITETLNFGLESLDVFEIVDYFLSMWWLANMCLRLFFGESLINDDREREFLNDLKLFLYFLEVSIGSMMLHWGYKSGCNVDYYAFCLYGPWGSICQV